MKPPAGQPPESETAQSIAIRRLTSADVAAMRAMLAMLGRAFDDVETFEKAPPRAQWLTRLLDRDTFVAIGAFVGDAVVGGLTAYVLPKYEQERSEVYLYDLAVAEPWRRRRIATRLIDELGAIAVSLGAWVIFVQADYGDDPAVALYTKLGVREDVMHFDIQPRR